MKDIKRLRGYKKQVFEVPGKPGVLRQRRYIYPVHYENRLLVGDGEYGYRKIDATLLFDEQKKGWTFEYNNFHPLVPEYADEVIAFRDVYHDKDQTVSLRAIAQHVKGRLVEKIEGVSNGYNAVVYDNAFGEGIDLIVHPTAVGLRKLVRLREYTKDKDLTFDFEIETPEELPSVVAKNRKEARKGNKADLKEARKLTGKERIIVGNPSQNKRREGQTYIKQVRVWDSGEHRHTEIAEAELIKKGNKQILRKKITADFLQKAEGFVYTDATTTIAETQDTYYGSANDTGGQPDSDTLRTGASVADGFYEAFIWWDLTDSPLPEKTLSATVGLTVKAVDTNNPLNRFNVVTSSWDEEDPTSATPPTVTTGYDTYLPNPITIGVDGLSETEINNIYENWKKGTFANYGVRINFESGTDTCITDYYSSDDSTESNRPYLEIFYIGSVETNTKQLFPGGLVLASPSTSATNYAHLFGQGSAETWSTTANFRKVLVSEDGSIKRVAFKLTTAPGAGKSYTFQFRRNDSAVWQTSISGTNTTATLFVDREILAGDDIVIVCIPSGTPAATTATWGIEFWPAGDNYTLPAGTGSGAATDGSTNYNNPMVGGSWFSGEVNRHQIVPHDGTIKSFYAKMFSAPGAAASGKQWTLKIRKNGADVTGSDIVIFEDETSASVEDIDVAVSAGDRLAVSIVGANTPTASAGAWAISILPDTPGESAILSSTGNALDATQVQYHRATNGGAFGENTTESNVIRLIGSEDWDGGTTNPIGAIIKNLYFRLSAAPGAGESYAIEYRLNASDTGLVATVSDTATDASDTSHSFNITNGDEINVKITPSASPSAPIATWSVVEYIPPSPVDLQKSAAYTVITSTDNTLGLEYAIIQEIGITLGSTYTVKAPEEVTKSTAYTVITTTENTLGLEYAVAAPVDITKGITYTVKSPVDVTLGSVYTVITTTEMTLGAEYEVISPVEITLGSTYTVKSPVEITLASTYDVKTPQEITLGAQYEVLTATDVTLGLVYEIISPVEITLGLDYFVLIEGNEITLGNVYEVISPQEITLSATYEVISPVEITLGSVYEVLTETEMTLGSTYEVITENELTLSSTYEVIVPVAITLGAVYEIITPQEITLGSTYTIIAPEEITLSSSYEVITETEITKSSAYTVLIPTDITLSSTYTIKAPEEITKTDTYTVITTTSVSLGLTYQILTETAITKGAQYAIKAEESVTKSAKYTVISAVGITKTLKYNLRVYPYTPKSGIYTPKVSPYTPLPRV